MTAARASRASCYVQERSTAFMRRWQLEPYLRRITLENTLESVLPSHECEGPDRPVAWMKQNYHMKWNCAGLNLRTRRFGRFSRVIPPTDLTATLQDRFPNKIDLFSAK
jgi:hypothetical protein